MRMTRKSAKIQKSNSFDRTHAILDAQGIYSLKKRICCHKLSPPNAENMHTEVEVKSPHAKVQPSVHKSVEQIYSAN